jgi:hypothetical protein
MLLRMGMLVAEMGHLAYLTGKIFIHHICDSHFEIITNLWLKQAVANRLLNLT